MPPNVPNVPMQVQQLSASSSSATATGGGGSGLLSRQTASASASAPQQRQRQQQMRGPHDYSASWKIGTTDRSAVLAAAAAAAADAAAAAGGPVVENGGANSSGDGGGGSAPPQAPQSAGVGSVANQMGVSHGSGGSGTGSSTGGGINRIESLSSLSQLHRGDGSGRKKKLPGQQGRGDNNASSSTAAAAAAAGVGVMQLQSQSQSQSSAEESRQKEAPAPAAGAGADTSGGSTAATASSTTSAPPSTAAAVGDDDGGISSSPPPPRPSTTSPPPPTSSSSQQQQQSFQSTHQDRLFHQPSDAVESVLSASCDVMGFDIAEMWLRTGPKTHQLTNSHLRPTALEDSVRAELVDVYYGEMSSRRTHRLSPALCKRAKEAQDVVWVTANTERGAEALRCSISDVRTAVAVPVCHESSRTNITFIYFSIRRAIVRPQAVEFLVHMSLSAAVASVNSLAEDVMVVDTARQVGASHPHSTHAYGAGHGHGHAHPPGASAGAASRSDSSLPLYSQLKASAGAPQPKKGFSVTGACLDLKWNALKNVEYLTDGGNNWIHTAVMDGRPVVVKTLKPECQDLALAINEIEGELDIHSKLDHPNIVGLVGAGTTSKGSRFVVLERLDGGTLTQHLGYDTRIRDRRRRFWKKKQFSYVDVLNCAKSVADAMAYCHGSALPGSMVLHRDLKPDNIGFTLDGTVKLIDFGLARVVEGAKPESDDVYEMSGETGSLRYMAPEVADCRSYNHKADVYSFGTILWEIVAYKKPYDGMNRQQFYDQVVHGGMRPPLSKKWPKELSNLISECWDVNYHIRPTFREIAERLDVMREREKGGGKKASARKRISALVDRHSTWF